MKLDYPVFDSDNHLYETEESFTRHLPREYANEILYVDVRGRTKIAFRGHHIDSADHIVLKRLRGEV